MPKSLKAQQRLGAQHGLRGAGRSERRRGRVYIAVAVSRGRSGRGGRGGRTWRTMRAWSGQADGQMAADEAVERTSGRGGWADEAQRSQTVERTGAERMRTVERTGGQGPRGADTRTGERGADRAQEARTDGQAVGQTSGLGGRGRKSCGRADWADGRTGADRQTSGRADERVGLGLKGHIPRG